MFKTLQSTLLGNILPPSDRTAIQKPHSRNKVPGPFPPQYFLSLKIRITDIHQIKPKGTAE